MSGKRLGSFRAGDRSEYLAAFALSRVAFVDPVPRQEDFGVVDFLCVLAREEGKHVYPDSAFYVQVKSAKQNIILDADAIRWISLHMDHPLLLCISDKVTGKLTFYSCARIWLALFWKVLPRQIMLRLDSNSPPEHATRHDSPAGTEFEVYAGFPIVEQTVSEFEQNPETARTVLEAWIRMDAENIARRRIGRIAVRCFWNWSPNVVPAAKYLHRYYIGRDYADAERDVAPILIGLAHNYIRARDTEKLAAVRQMLKVLYPLLDAHGRQIADGELGIE